MNRLKFNKTLSSKIQIKFSKESVFSKKSQKYSPQEDSASSQDYLRRKITLSPADKEARNTSIEQLKAVKSWLEETFPKAFNFKDPIPLKQGIQKDVLTASSYFSKTQRRKGISSYVNSTAYLKAIVNGQWRYNLNGEMIEEITQAQKEYAQQELLFREKGRNHKKTPNDNKTGESSKIDGYNINKKL